MLTKRYLWRAPTQAGDRNRGVPPHLLTSLFALCGMDSVLSGTPTQLPNDRVFFPTQYIPILRLAQLI
jgi:hypothetical protein